MIAIDTNLLVYAHRKDSDWHDQATRIICACAEERAPWAIPWPCLHEFLAVATHPRVYDPPTPLTAALDQVDAWLESPSLQLLSETPDYWPRLGALLIKGAIAGSRVHDARIAALCLAHGVRELLTADRDFGRFPDLATRNPLVG